MALPVTPGIKAISVLPCSALPKYIEPRSLAGQTYYFKDFEAAVLFTVPLYSEATLNRNLYCTPKTRVDEVKLSFNSNALLADAVKNDNYAYIVEYVDGRRYLIGTDEHIPKVETDYIHGDVRTGEYYKYDISLKGLYSMTLLV